jgi:membrane protein implicated in regulation of membrane protease activity
MMKLQKMFGSLTQVEMIALAVFVLYIVFPIENPQFISNMVDTPLGMVGVLAVTLYLFFNANPLVAILYVFVAYELLRRSSKQTGKAAIQEHTPTQAKKDKKMEKMNPVKKESLEEEIVEKMAPIGHSDPVVFSETAFKPVAEDVGTASMY